VVELSHKQHFKEMQNEKSAAFRDWKRKQLTIKNKRSEIVEYR